MAVVPVPVARRRPPAPAGLLAVVYAFAVVVGLLDGSASAMVLAGMVMLGGAARLLVRGTSYAVRRPG